MNWENVADIALWADKNMPKLENYHIYEVKIKNRGNGFEVIVAYEHDTIIMPKLVRRVIADSYGHIVKTNEMKV